MFGKRKKLFSCLRDCVLEFFLFDEVDDFETFEAKQYLSLILWRLLVLLYGLIKHFSILESVNFL
jgi:hypothetical protein